MAASHVGDDGFTYDVGVHFITNRLAAAVGIGAMCRLVPHYGEVVRTADARTLGYPLGLMLSGKYLGSALAGRLRRLSSIGRQAAPIVSAADRFRYDYGRALANEIANPIAEAWAGLPADQLAAAVADKLPPQLLQLLWLRAAQRISHRAVAIGYCADRPQNAGVFHVYPLGGVAEVCGALARRLPLPVQVDSPAQRIYVDNGRVVGVRIAERDIDTDLVVSTLPINRLGSLVVGSTALERFAQFRHRALVLVNLKLHGRGLLPDVVVWTPTGFPFFRLTEAPLSMPQLAPDGKTIVLCDFGAAVGDALWTASDESLVERSLSGLEPLIPDVRQRLIGANVMRQPLGYPIHSLEYEAERASLAEHGTGIAGLHSIGRNGEFEHILMEDIFWRTVRRIGAITRSTPVPA